MGSNTIPVFQMKKLRVRMVMELVKFSKSSRVSGGIELGCMWKAEPLSCGAIQSMADDQAFVSIIYV